MARPEGATSLAVRSQHPVTESEAHVARAVVTRFYIDMWNHFDVDLLAEITSAAVTFQGSLGDRTVGREGLLKYVAKIRRAFPDFRNEIVQLVAEGSSAFARLHYTGTHTGPLGELQPTGNQINYDGAALFRITDGRIDDVWVLGDRLALETQLGMHAGCAKPDR